MTSNNPPDPMNNKRKRDLHEQEQKRTMKAPNTNGDVGVQDPIYASLLQGIEEDNADPSRTAQAALQQQAQSSYPEPNVFDQASVAGGLDDHGVGMPQGTQHHGFGPPGAQRILDMASSQQNKPAVGSQAWHQQRKDNHKEVERRRREVINEGIENIAKLIPGADKNKGAILQNACRYIGELHGKIKDFDNERRLFEVAQAELVSRNNSLRDNAERAWTETQKWMNRCRDAGLQFDDYDAGLENGDLDGSTAANFGAMNSSNEPGDFSMGGAEKNDNAVS